MNSSVEGKVWRFGPNIDTDQIIPAEYLVTPDPKELAPHAFEKARPKFAKKVAPGDIIVADRNFGCGSSREHAPRGLMGAGISCVVAASFARIFFRNSINIGLPLVEAEIEAEDGDRLRVDFDKGVVENLSNGNSATFPAYAEFLRDLINRGGLIPYAREKLSEERMKR